ncbi:MAG: aspartate--tRNA ligase [Ectothiorhodospiraceae bacterium]|nr:aspartate--tRNA ligase [Ectothiorhodospiraceae bacterium]
MTFTKRTHNCGELRTAQIGKTVTLNGWVDGRRDLGGMIFIDLRDRWGITQVTFVPQHNAEVHERAHELRSEYVLSITGTVQGRPEGQENKDMATGEIEILVDEFQILNRAEVLPFEIEDEVEAHEDLRLKYRYLDLRRPLMQKYAMLRSSVYQVVHSYFAEHDFVEVETPTFIKSTPEGARDFLVPSRIHRGKFYALPQSPQMYKQILMVAGFDRYVQIVKCFRDEDFRADRQPEFTQIDLEMSFVTAEDVYAITEGLVARMLKECIGYDVQTPFLRMSYDDAMEQYGTDKPDLRFDMKLVPLNDLVVNSGFKVFADAAQKGGTVTGFCVKGKAEYSRKQLDELTEVAKKFGAGGLVWMKVEAAEMKSPVAKFLSPEILAQIQSAMGAEEGDLLLIVADADKRKAQKAAGSLRLHLGKELGLCDPNKHALLWVVDFPMFAYNEEEGVWEPEHHAFTSPKAEDIEKMDTDPGAVRADCYDFVWNGNEAASGSIRIHDSAMQTKIFERLGLSDEELQEKFGFLVESFKYGAPPHGGIALGLDRVVAILAGLTSIREVIAFPKTNTALSLMDGSPSMVDERALKDLHLDIRKEEKKP